MSDIEIQLQKHLPQTSAIDARSREVKSTFELTNAEFERARNNAKRARQAFEKVKKERYDRFNALYEHVSGCIDDIYKSLTNSQAAVSLSNSRRCRRTISRWYYLQLCCTWKTFPSDGKFIWWRKNRRCYLSFICITKVTILSERKRNRFILFYYSFKPAPFFLLDEVDAALDNTNIGKVADFIREQSASEFQCIVISLKEQFYSRADALVGIYPEVNIVDLVNKFTFSFFLF